MKLSPHFTLEELTENWRGGSIEARNIELAKDPVVLAKLEQLCTLLLEPARVAFNRPITVNSGFRYAELVDGKWTGIDYEIRSPAQKKVYKPTSQHTRGEAADIVMPGVSTRELWNWYKDNCPHPFGQLIYEVNPRSSWVHISLPGWTLDKKRFMKGELMDAKVDAQQRAIYTRVGTKTWE